MQARALSLSHLGPEEEGVSSGRHYFLGPVLSPQNRGDDKAPEAATAGGQERQACGRFSAKARPFTVSVPEDERPSNRRGAGQVVPKILAAGSARLSRGKVPLSRL